MAQDRVRDLLLSVESDLVVHTGDVVYPLGAIEIYQRNFFEVYREHLARVPWFPSPGNHDAGWNLEDYKSVFHLPTNSPLADELDDSYDAGPVHFVALNSTTTIRKDGPSREEIEFVYGDTNESGSVGIGDAISILGYLFRGDIEICDIEICDIEICDIEICDPASDVTRDGFLRIDDAISILQYLFVDPQIWASVAQDGQSAPRAQAAGRRVLRDGLRLADQPDRSPSHEFHRLRHTRAAPRRDASDDEQADERVLARRRDS